MLDVHPPHEPVHGWRDFLLHILTITIGLLIALGLEAGLEWIHHRHVVAEARENIRREIEDNRKLIAADRQSINADIQRMGADMVALRALRDNPNAKVAVTLNWTWSGLSSSAWTSARDTGALTLMTYSKVQGFADVYTQQQLVNDAGTLLFQTQSKALVPMSIEENFKNAQPSQIDEALHRCAEVIVQLHLLNDLLDGLEASYNHALTAS